MSKQKPGQAHPGGDVSAKELVVALEPEWGSKTTCRPKGHGTSSGTDNCDVLRFVVRHTDESPEAKPRRNRLHLHSKP